MMRIFEAINLNRSSLSTERHGGQLRSQRIAKFCDKKCCQSIVARHAITLLLVAVTFLLSGCQSTAYRAGELPSRFRIAARSNRQSIDFSRVASAGTSDAVIAPSDLLDITVATGREDEKINPITARVADDGMVMVPVIGPVPVAGMESLEASQSITQQAIQRGMYLNPLITVEIKSKSVNRITVLGAVNEPGLHEIPRGSSDLVSAIAAAGGLTDEAGTEVEIVRHPTSSLVANQNNAIASPPDGTQLASYQGVGQQANRQPFEAPTVGIANPTTVRLDLSSRGPASHVDVRLDDRDVVRIVPRKKETIYVSGLVRKPGMFELPDDQDIHLLDAIALAGGRGSPVADKIFVIRRVENRPEPIVIQASLSKAKRNGLENIRLTAGDTITVEQTPTTAIVDSIKHFFRLSYGVASSTVF